MTKFLSTIILSIFLTVSFQSFAQNKVCGSYKGYIEDDMHQNPEFYQSISEKNQSLKQEFERIQDELAIFNDKNQIISSSKFNVKKFKLENKFNLINGVYQELAKQVELSKIQVTKDTPVFTILKNADVPTKKHKPKRSLITILFTLVGIIYSFGFLFFKKYGFNL